MFVYGPIARCFISAETLILRLSEFDVRQFFSLSKDNAFRESVSGSVTTTASLQPSSSSS